MPVAPDRSGEDVVGYLRASEISRDRAEDARNVLKEGDEVTAVVNVDREDPQHPARQAGDARRPAGSHASLNRTRHAGGTATSLRLLRASWTTTVEVSKGTVGRRAMRRRAYDLRLALALNAQP